MNEIADFSEKAHLRGIDWDFGVSDGPPVGDRRLAALMMHVVAAVTGIEPGRIAVGNKEPRAAMARQVAMYLAHTGLDWTQARTGIAFGREKSTVSYACSRVEDRREDADFDRRIAQLEAWVNIFPLTGGLL